MQSTSLFRLSLAGILMMEMVDRKTNHSMMNLGVEISLNSLARLIVHEDGNAFLIYDGETFTFDAVLPVSGGYSGMPIEWQYMIDSDRFRCDCMSNQVSDYQGQHFYVGSANFRRRGGELRFEIRTREPTFSGVVCYLEAKLRIVSFKTDMTVMMMTIKPSMNTNIICGIEKI